MKFDTVWNDFQPERDGLISSLAPFNIHCLDVLHVSDAIAEVYGRVKASLESQGVIVGDNDLWIAATALDLAAHS